jgi:hypothetical protein
MTIDRLKYYLYTWLSCCVALVLIASCSQDDESSAKRGMGYITFGGVSISAEIGGNTRAGFSVPAPNAADLNIEVIDKDNNVVESDTYGNLSGQSILVPLGTYTIRAYYGTKSAIGTAPYFEGSTTHTVQDMSVADANTVAEVSASLQSSVVIPSIPTSSHFSDLKCVVACGSETKSLDNNEVAYMLPGYTYNVSYVGVNSYGRTITTTVLSNYQPTATKPEVQNLSFTLKLTLPDQSAGAWAKRFYVTPIKTLNSNNESVELTGVTYQISSDNSTWSDISSKDAGYYCATNLTANTKYYVRAVLDDIYSDSKEITTEKDTPINYQGTECGDLEDWCSTAGKSYFGDIGWYLYYPRATKDEDSVEGWCTLNSYTTSISSNNHLGYINNSGTMPTSDCASGSKAAEIATIGWGSGSTAITGGASTATEGELFLGTISDNTPNYYYTLSSRPSAVEFYTKYTPVNSQNFSVEFEVFDENKNSLASGTLSEGAISSYVKRTITLDYGSNKNKKAKYIKLKFKSGSNTTSELTAVKLVSTSVSSRGVRHTGNKLYIDNVKLIYE